MAEVGDVNFCLKIQNKGDKIWNFHKKFLSLQRQNICFDYPVSFRVGARLDRHYSIFKQRVTSCGSFVILHNGG